MSASPPVVASVLAPEAVAALARERHDLPDGPLECELLNRGFNDHYLLRAGGERFVLRVYAAHK